MFVYLYVWPGSYNAEELSDTSSDDGYGAIIDPLIEATEASRDEHPGEEELDENDPVFTFPFMGGEEFSGEDEQEAPPRTDERADACQNPRGWNNFGGERGTSDNSAGGAMGRRPSSYQWRNPASFWSPPRAMSTLVERQAQELSRPGGLRLDGAEEARRFGRFTAPAQFEKGIAHSEKYNRWLKWKNMFDVAMSVCGGRPTEAQKAGLLYTHVGDEVRDIISMLELPPMHGGRRVKQGEYVELISGVSDYFHSLVDETTDFARYTTRKQQGSEPVHEFALKLQDLAARVNVARDSIGYRHHFLAGLRDRDFAKKAMVEGMQMGQILRQVSILCR